MPRRAIKVNVENPDELPENEDTSMGGFPEHGDELEEGNPVEEIEEEGEPEPQKANGVDYNAQFKAIQDELGALRAENAQLRSTIPPPQRVKEETGDETDWNDEFYKDVPGAIKKLEANILKKAESTLTAKYQQDIGQRTFWSRFYASHPDLEDADDLVRSTLSGNMNQLGGLSIPKAIEGLAGLTRNRISVYVDKAVKARGKKATVEGAGSTLPNSRQNQQTATERPYSLSSAIKNRRAKRAAAS